VGKQFMKKKFFDHIQRMCQAVYAMKKEYPLLSSFFPLLFLILFSFSSIHHKFLLTHKSFRAQFEADLVEIPLDEKEQHK
jgi:hypothetical protein